MNRKHVDFPGLLAPAADRLAEGYVIERIGYSHLAAPGALQPQRPECPLPDFKLEPAVDIERHSYLEIRDRQRRQLVTVIELLSPSNKSSGPDRDQYLGKRERILASRTHLVELDLLRGGPRLPLEDLPACDYYAMVSRCNERPRVGLWPIGLRDRLPTIPIPLLPPDPDARLDLQAVLNHVYDAAGYEDYVYANPPEPALGEADAAWARQFARVMEK